MIKKFRIELIIALAAALLFIPFLGAVHLFDWDEINFAESAREMIVTGNYSKVQINFSPFWEKPPLFIWMQVLCMKLFGINEVAARLPNVIFGIITLCFIYNIGRKIFKGHIAHWWVLCYMGAIAPHFYFKTGLIDPVFNFFIFCSIYQLYLALARYQPNYNNVRHFVLAGIFTGIAILTKGPVAMLIALLVLFSLVVSRKWTWFFGFKQLFLFFLFAGFVTAIWIIPETIKNGPYFIIEFLNYQLGLFSQNIAGHQQPFYYHALVLLVGCFPISIIAIAAWRKNEYYTYQENLFRLVMLCLFWVVLILFSIVKTKIVHYSSLCWLPLTFLAAYSIEGFNEKIFKFKWYFKVLLVFIGIIISCVFIAMPIILSRVELRNYMFKNINDAFTKANFTIDAGWQIFDSTGGFLLLIVIIGFIVLMAKKQTIKAFGVLLVGNAVVLFLTAALVVPKVEKHTQGTAIQFFETLKGKNVYIFNVGYKSYAPFFYAQTQPLGLFDGLNLLNLDYFKMKGVKNFLALNETERAQLDDIQKRWLMDGKVDKPVYFIAKINAQEDLPEHKNLKILFNKAGFIGYQRID